MERTDQADEDITDILVYLGRRSASAAARFRAALDRTARLLARSPRLGRERPELGSDLRSYPLGGTHIIYYRAIPNGIEIARVLHGARDVDASLFDG